MTINERATLNILPAATRRTGAAALGDLHVCKVCPKRDSCGYNRQRSQRSSIWVTTSALLFAGRPEPIGKPDLIVMDEAFHNHAPHGLNDDELVTMEEFLKKTDHLRVKALQLDGLRDLLAAAVRKVGTGRLTAEALREVGLTALECTTAESLEWEKKPKISLEEGIPAAALVERLREKADPQLPLRARILGIAAATLGGSSEKGFCRNRAW